MTLSFDCSILVIELSSWSVHQRQRISFRQRYHNATGSGALTYPGGSQPVARVSYIAMYPDAVGRSQATANYGTNGDASLSRPSTIPARADTVLVISTL